MTTPENLTQDQPFQAEAQTGRLRALAERFRDPNFHLRAITLGAGATDRVIDVADNIANGHRFTDRLARAAILKVAPNAGAAALRFADRAVIARDNYADGSVTGATAGLAERAQLRAAR